MSGTFVKSSDERASHSRACRIPAAHMHGTDIKLPPPRVWAMQREAHRPPPSLLAPRPCEPPTAGWCQCTAIGKLLLRSGRRLCIEHLKKYKTCTRSQLMPGASPAADARAGACRRRPRHRRRRQPFLPPCTLTRSISFRTNPLEEAIQQISRPPKAFAKGLTAAESPASRRYLHSHRPPKR